MAIKDLIPWRLGGTPVSSLEEGNPFAVLQRQMNRLMEDFMGGWGLSLAGSGSFHPRVNVWEDEEALHIEAELPGLTEKDVEVTLTSDYLKIRGEKKHERQEKHKGQHVSESAYGYFERTIPLSSEVDQDRIDALFKNGVLNIALRKTASEKQKSRKINIRSE